MTREDSVVAPQIDIAGRLALDVPLAPGFNVVLKIDAGMKRGQGIADAGIWELPPDLLRLAPHRQAAASWSAARAERGAHAAGRCVALLNQELVLGNQRINQRKRG